ncbi:MAG: J domain-containing protein [Nocardioides sp.]
MKDPSIISDPRLAVRLGMSQTMSSPTSSAPLPHRDKSILAVADYCEGVTEFARAVPEKFRPFLREGERVVAHEKPSPSEARALLGLTAVATPAQVSTAFRQQARRVHPDVSDTRDAAGRFAALVAAYQVALQAAQRQRTAASTSTPAQGPHEVVTGPGGTTVWEAGQPVFLVSPVRMHRPSSR